MSLLLVIDFNHINLDLLELYFRPISFVNLVIFLFLWSSSFPLLCPIFCLLSLFISIFFSSPIHFNYSSLCVFYTDKHIDFVSKLISHFRFNCIWNKFAQKVPTHDTRPIFFINIRTRTFYRWKKVNERFKWSFPTIFSSIHH